MGAARLSIQSQSVPYEHHRRDDEQLEANHPHGEESHTDVSDTSEDGVGKIRKVSWSNGRC